MIAYIITEGDSDVQLLKAIIPQHLLNEVGIIAAGGLSAVKSFARSLVARQQIPVVIVVDADSTDQKFIQERTQEIQEIVEGVAVDTPVKVILAVPTIESIFFEDACLLSKIMDFNVPNSIFELATSQPLKAKKILEELLPSPKKLVVNQFIDHQLKKEDIETLRNTKIIQEIIEFLESIRQPIEV
jgi:predicted ATP-dependent endonuclease of OLD family